jgi:hypothetical protein
VGSLLQRGGREAACWWLNITRGQIEGQDVALVGIRAGDLVGARCGVWNTAPSYDFVCSTSSQIMRSCEVDDVLHRLPSRNGDEVLRVLIVCHKIWNHVHKDHRRAW